MCIQYTLHRSVVHLDAAAADDLDLKGVTFRLRLGWSGGLRLSPNKCMKSINGNEVTSRLLLTTVRDYGKLGHFIVSAPIVFLSVSLFGSSPSPLHPFFSLYLNYFSASPFPPFSCLCLFSYLNCSTNRRTQAEPTRTVQFSYEWRKEEFFCVSQQDHSDQQTANRRNQSRQSKHLSMRNAGL